MKTTVLEKMRDCVRRALEEGSSSRHELKTMKHAIIVELQRLGCSETQIKDTLVEWNKKCTPPLGIGDVKRLLLNYVDWVFSNECKTGCTALEDYCIGKGECTFYKVTTANGLANIQKVHLDLPLLEQHLKQEYPGKEYAMMLVVKALRQFQLEKSVGELIYVGLRTLSSIIRDNFGHTLSPVEVQRTIRLLENEKVLEQVVKGERGQFKGKANGYRFLEWRP